LRIPKIENKRNIERDQINGKSKGRGLIHYARHMRGFQLEPPL
jgi:hypothetical protein